MIPDIVQLPFNFLDRRFENHFEKLNDLGVEIHARSIFLQGLLLREENNIPIQFKNNYKIIKYYKWIKKNNFSNLKICLSELDKIDYEKIIIGVNDINQLKEIINFKKHLNLSTDIFKTKNLKLIDPRKWNYSQTSI